MSWYCFPSAVLSSVRRHSFPLSASIRLVSVVVAWAPPCATDSVAHHFSQPSRYSPASFILPAHYAPRTIFTCSYSSVPTRILLFALSFTLCYTFVCPSCTFCQPICYSVSITDLPLTHLHSCPALCHLLNVFMLLKDVRLRSTTVSFFVPCSTFSSSNQIHTHTVTLALLIRFD